MVPEYRIPLGTSHAPAGTVIAGTVIALRSGQCGVVGDRTELSLNS